MSISTWSELVQDNVACFGDLVVGIDPSLADLPEFFGEESSWIADYVNFTLLGQLHASQP